jgi:hypothetical protein
VSFTDVISELATLIAEELGEHIKLRELDMVVKLVTTVSSRYKGRYL